MHHASNAVTTLVEFMCAQKRPLFHVTDESHLISIAEHGLLSHSEQRARGIMPIRPGGNAQTRSFDEDFGLSNYVFLGFSTAGLMPTHKAENRKRRPCLLHIDPRILLLPGSKLALGRNSGARQKINSVNRALSRIDEATVAIFRRLLEGESNWDDVTLQHRWRIYHVIDFEVLIPARVPPDLIGLYCPNAFAERSALPSAFHS